MKLNRIAAAAGFAAAIVGSQAFADNPDNPKFSYGTPAEMSQLRAQQHTTVTNTDAVQPQAIRSDSMINETSARNAKRWNLNASRSLSNPDSVDAAPN